MRSCFVVAVLLISVIPAAHAAPPYMNFPAVSMDSLREGKSAASQEVQENLRRLTEQFREAPPGKYCGTGLAQYYFEHQSELGPGARSAVAASWPGLIARPVLDSIYDVPGVPIRIHYNIYGPDSVRNATSDTAADGVPTYVHVAGEALARSWQLLIDSIGFAPPVGDSTAGGGLNLYDCYLARPAGQVFVIAFTAAEKGYYRVVGSDTVLFATSFQVVHSTMEPFPQLANRLDLLRITCAHELFHAIHFSMDVYEKPIWQKNGWWLEGTAAWFEDRVYPDINDWSYLPSYMNEPQRSIANSDLAFDLHPFGGGSLWTFYLWERFGGDQVIRNIWERCGLVPGDNTLSATAAELASQGNTIDQAWREFSGWCMRTGTDWDASSFSQGAVWPKPARLRTYTKYPCLLHMTNGQDSLRKLVDPAISDSTIGSDVAALGSLGFLPVDFSPQPTSSGDMTFYAAALLTQPVAFFYTVSDGILLAPIVEEADLPSRTATSITNWSNHSAMSMVAVAGVHYDSSTILAQAMPVLMAALDAVIVPVNGDVTDDGKVTSADIVFLVNYVLKGGIAPVPVSSADVNADCIVTAADIVWLVNYVFKAGPEPRAGCG